METKALSRLRWLRLTIETLILVLLMFLITRTILQNYHIRGHSMEPTLHDQEYIVVNKAAYLLQEPHRGDIIVFQYPGDLNEDYIKRVIAIPGDKVSIIGNQVIVNGIELNETYIQPQNRLNPYPEIENKIITPDNYFVLGDNRAHSSDSRQWGLVPRSNIIGEAIIIYWPLDQDNFGLLPDMSDVFSQTTR